MDMQGAILAGRSPCRLYRDVQNRAWKDYMGCMSTRRVLHVDYGFLITLLVLDGLYVHGMFCFFNGDTDVVRRL